MGQDQLPEQYLQRAREAEEFANASKNKSMKASWREIANGYRNLAYVRLHFFPSEGAS